MLKPGLSNAISDTPHILFYTRGQFQGLLVSDIITKLKWIYPGNEK